MQHVQFHLCENRVQRTSQRKTSYGLTEREKLTHYKKGGEGLVYNKQVKVFYK